MNNLKFFKKKKKKNWLNHKKIAETNEITESENTTKIQQEVAQKVEQTEEEVERLEKPSVNVFKGFEEALAKKKEMVLKAKQEAKEASLLDIKSELAEDSTPAPKEAAKPNKNTVDGNALRA